MKNLTILLLVVFVFTACKNEENKENVSQNGKIEITDDLGVKIVLEKTPEKIISLAPNLTEIVFAAGAGDKLIADTRFCNYPPAADTLPEVGDLLTINFEKITAMQPDLILVTIEGNSKDNYDRLTELGHTVFVSNPRDYEGIKKTVRDIAYITGNKSVADSLCDEWDKDIKRIIKDVPEGEDQPVVMFMAAANPIMLAGVNTFVNEYLKLLNLRNIAEGVDLNYPVFSREKIMETDPDYIFYPGMEKNVRESVLDLYPEWKNLSAFRNGNFHTLDPDLFYRPGPRFTKALDTLKSKINLLPRHQ